MSRLTLALAPLVLALASCGGKASGSPEDGGGSDSGGAGSGGKAGGRAGNGRAGDGRAGNGSAGDACSRYDDDSPTDVMVAIVNKTNAPIHLGERMTGCSRAAYFHVANGSGQPLPSIGDCRSSCVGARTQGVGGCASICLFPTAVTVQAGEVWATSYDGLFSVPGELPGSCVSYAMPSSTVTCDQAKRIEPGSYTFSAQAGTSLDCSQTSPEAACPPCQPDGDGGCLTPASLIAGKLLETKSTIMLDERYGVFGSPNADPSGNESESGAASRLTVELVFTN